MELTISDWCPAKKRLLYTSSFILLLSSGQGTGFSKLPSWIPNLQWSLFYLKPCSNLMSRKFAQDRSFLSTYRTRVCVVSLFGYHVLLHYICCCIRRKWTQPTAILLLLDKHWVVSWCVGIWTSYWTSCIWLVLQLPEIAKVEFVESQSLWNSIWGRHSTCPPTTHTHTPSSIVHSSPTQKSAAFFVLFLLTSNFIPEVMSSDSCSLKLRVFV